MNRPQNYGTLAVVSVQSDDEPKPQRSPLGLLLAVLALSTIGAAAFYAGAATGAAKSGPSPASAVHAWSLTVPHVLGGGGGSRTRRAGSVPTHPDGRASAPDPKRARTDPAGADVIWYGGHGAAFNSPTYHHVAPGTAAPPLADGGSPPSNATAVANATTTNATAANVTAADARAAAVDAAAAAMAAADAAVAQAVEDAMNTAPTTRTEDTAIYFGSDPHMMKLVAGLNNDADGGAAAINSPTSAHRPSWAQGFHPT